MYSFGNPIRVEGLVGKLNVFSVFWKHTSLTIRHGQVDTRCWETQNKLYFTIAKDTLPLKETHYE